MPNMSSISSRGWSLLNTNLVSGCLAAFLGHQLTKTYRDEEVEHLTDELAVSLDNEKRHREAFDDRSKSLEDANSRIVGLMLQLQGKNSSLQACWTKSAALLSDLQSSWCINRYSSHKAIPGQSNPKEEVSGGNIDKSVNLADNSKNEP